MTSNGQKASGFTLLEVLIALVVLAVGMVAVIQFQNTLLNSATETDKRAMAFQVAEGVMEHARAYEERSEIGNWSLPTSAALSYGGDSIPFNIQSQTILLDSGLNTVSSLGEASFAELILTVSPQVGSSAETTVQLSTLIGKIHPGEEALLDNSGTGGAQPNVTHVAGQTPDVVPIQLSDTEIRETSKPLPEVVSKNASTEVTFETVVYDSSTNKQVQEEFLTVNCVCQLSSVATPSYANESPYHYRYDVNSESLYVNGGVAGNSSTTGVPYYGTASKKFDQSSFCSRCCAGHHDISAVSSGTLYDGYPPFKPNSIASTPHPHYVFDVDTGEVSTAVASDGDYYPESCRFRRVDGIFRLFPDWNMDSLTVFSLTEGASSGALSTYQDYVRAKLQDVVFNTTSAATYAASVGVNVSLTPGSSEQLLARGLYLDDMSYDSDWQTAMGSVSPSDYVSGAWLSIVPFNEINMTLLAEWSSGSTAVAAVTDEEVETVDALLNYYGSYSRGLVTADAGASTADSTLVKASSKFDNTGILGNRYSKNNLYFAGVDNKEIPTPTRLEDDLQIDIVGTSTGVQTFTVEVREDATNGQVTVASGKLSITTSVGSCSYDSETNGVATINCTAPENTTMTITISTSQNGEAIFGDMSVGDSFSGGVVTSITETSPSASITVALTAPGSGTDPVKFRAYEP